MSVIDKCECDCIVVFVVLFGQFFEQCCVVGVVGMIGYCEVGVQYVGCVLFVVLLYGIGLGVVLWVCQFDMLGVLWCVFVWDVFGYGVLMFVYGVLLVVVDYVVVLNVWFEVFGIECCVLVGYLFGVIIVGGFVCVMFV